MLSFPAILIFYVLNDVRFDRKKAKSCVSELCLGHFLFNAAPKFSIKIVVV
jgi:hypothetical protein